MSYYYLWYNIHSQLFVGLTHKNIICCIKVVTITTNAAAISSTETVVSSHAKAILSLARHAARSDVSKCLLGGAGFRKSPPLRNEVSVTHVYYKYVVSKYPYCRAP